MGKKWINEPDPPVKSDDADFTSDGSSRSNLMTRDEFLRKVLYSGELTQISQHIALVVFLVAEGKNQLNLSLRDLERITGWSRRAIKEHLDELEVFMRVTFGGGRAKALFELQGVIEDALATAVINGALSPQNNLVAGQAPTNPKPVVAGEAPTNDVVAGQPPTTVVAGQAPTSGFMVPHVPTNTLVGGYVATSLMAAVVPTTGLVAGQVPTNPPVAAVVAGQVPTNAPLYRERESISFNTSLSLTTPRAREDDPIQLNGVAISGPGFKIDLKAIDLAAGMIGMPKERARAIAEICARDWAATGEKPRSPMARVKSAIMADFNQGQVQDVRMEKARAEAKPEQRNEDRQKRWDEIAERVEADLQRKRRT